MAWHKTYIPKHFFSKCKVIKKESEWVNSELTETDTSEEFDGAVFNLNRKDISMLIEQGIQITLDSKKIYCYRDIGLKDTIEYQGNKYVVNTERNYLQHDELRIYYIERMQE